MEITLKDILIVVAIVLLNRLIDYIFDRNKIKIEYGRDVMYLHCTNIYVMINFKGKYIAVSKPISNSLHAEFYDRHTYDNSEEFNRTIVKVLTLIRKNSSYNDVSKLIEQPHEKQQKE